MNYFGTPSCSVELTEGIVTQLEPQHTGTSTPTSSTRPGLLFTLAPAPSTRSTVIASTTTPASQPVPTVISATPSSSSAPPSLSTSAKIGIGVGVPLGVLVAFIAIVCLWLRRRSEESPSNGKKRKRRSGWRAYFQNKGELDAEGQRIHEAESAEQRRELDAEVKHELEVIEKRQELVGADCAQELGPREC